MKGMKGRFVRIAKVSICFILSLRIYLPSRLCGQETIQETASGLPVMFWNLENYFDSFDDSLTRDDEFTPAGGKHWTWKEFLRKRNMIAKTIMSVKDYCGEFPVIAGFAECENKMVLNQLVYKTPLAKLDYRVIHRDSPDARGIDVAMIYREEFFKPFFVKNIEVPIQERKTRDILKVSGVLCEDTLDFYFLHFPSKFNGAHESAPLRIKAAETLMEEVRQSLDSGRKTIVCGDFNDTPFSPPLKAISDSLIVNLAQAADFKNKGTIKFNGKWELIDQFLISENLYRRCGGRSNGQNNGQSGVPSHISCSDMKILELPHLLERDDKFLGVKPFRTYIGPKYHGGASDHLPILIQITINN